MYWLAPVVSIVKPSVDTVELAVEFAADDATIVDVGGLLAAELVELDVVSSKSIALGALVNTLATVSLRRPTICQLKSAGKVDDFHLRDSDFRLTSWHSERSLWYVRCGQCLESN